MVSATLELSILGDLSWLEKLRLTEAFSSAKQLCLELLIDQYARHERKRH